MKNLGQAHGTQQEQDQLIARFVADGIRKNLFGSDDQFRRNVVAGTKVTTPTLNEYLDRIQKTSGQTTQQFSNDDVQTSKSILKVYAQNPEFQQLFASRKNEIARALNVNPDQLDWMIQNIDQTVDSQVGAGRTESQK